jgi:uroporphyrinogen decarboxylase
MNSRELVRGMLAHRDVPRPAIDLGGTDCSSIHAIGYGRLKKHLGLDPRPTHVTDVTQFIALIDPELQDRFAGDVVTLDFMPRAFKSYTQSDGSTCLVPERFNYETNAAGEKIVRSRTGAVVSRMPAGGLYFEPVNAALAEVEDAHKIDKTLDCLLHADEPAFLDEPLDAMEARAEKLYRESSRAVIFQIRFHIMQVGQILRGYENYMTDLALRPELVEAIHETLTQVYIERGLRLLDRLGKYCDALFFCEDLGTQNGTLLSPEMYRRLLKPYMKRMFDALRAHSGHPIILHSCGSVHALIPDLIEIGVDALNPVQVTAAGMDSAKLVREFGRDIVFWGGGCDTQHVLDRPGTGNVAREVKKRLADFSRARGYVFCAVHNIQANVPPENVVALYDTAGGIIGKAR